MPADIDPGLGFRVRVGAPLVGALRGRQPGSSPLVGQLSRSWPFPRTFARQRPKATFVTTDPRVSPRSGRRELPNLPRFVLEYRDAISGRRSAVSGPRAAVRSGPSTSCPGVCSQEADR